MRKRNEGYALPLVLVVMVVLCLVAVSIMTVSLRNMQSQRASIEQMQDQYTAEGAIEAVLAQMESTTAFTVETGKDVKTTLKEKLSSYCDSLTEEGKCEVSITGEPALTNSGTSDFSYAFSLTAVSGETQVTCDMVLAGTLTGTLPNYIVGSSTITYKTYTVSTLTEGGDAV